MRLLALASLTSAFALGCGASTAGAGSGSTGAGGTTGGTSTGAGGGVSGPSATASSVAVGTTGASMGTLSAASASSGTTSSGGSSVGSGGSSGSGGAAPSSGDCQSDADCPSGQCVPLTPGGYRACLTPPSPAASCGSALDQCCPAMQQLCPNGEPCYAGPLVPVCTGTPVPMYNQCAVDQCSKDLDCAPNQICALAGTLGLQIRACVTAYCKIDADCEAYPGGACAPVREPCCSTYAGLYCVYPSQGGCRSDADCPPTTAEPHRFCAPSAGGVATCLTGAPDCPQ